ncbi:hypothetical protein HP550_17565 [Cellulomonas humilata]|uniref:Peptidase metallopeptidase domain-containing protein n=1 Tax=Cellulomonas humilata TaxID=144055 RepID=A0A7Y6DZ44_9CELL|nr:hypothetical protein [Cellulomonas humilata]NUU19060.1 hypothetical protein [Cellulomonas humilata]
MPELPQIRAAARRVRVDFGTQKFKTFHVVEGDLLLDDDELALYALRRAAAHPARGVQDPAPSAQLEPSGALAGISVGGKTVRWDAGKVLRYCIFRESFPSTEAYAHARRCVAEAARAWEATCDVHFAHADSWDGHDNPAAALADLDPDLVFAVRYIDMEGKPVAASFFPTSPPARRRVFLDPAFFGEELIYDPVGVMRHELGHVLGFRHEHIRSGAPPDCPTDEDKVVLSGLSPYDPTSVMHYFCGGVGSTTLEISECDREGAQKLYGPPSAESRVPVA